MKNIETYNKYFSDLENKIIQHPAGISERNKLKIKFQRKENF